MRLVVPALRILGAQLLVVLVVGPLGFAIGDQQGLRWAVAGAAVWALLFSLAAAWLHRSTLTWGVAGGLVCGGAWSFGNLVGEYLISLAFGSYDYRWACLVGAFGGVGAGLMAGAVWEVVPDSAFRRLVRYGAWAAAVTWGVLGAASPYVSGGIGTRGQNLVWGVWGALGGVLAMPVSWEVGRWLSPVIVFFEELGPYLTEMTRPLAAFATGFLTLIVVFAGFYGMFWRFDSDSFQNLPSNAGIWEFVEFSLATATTENTAIVARSGATRVLAGLEVILATGWLIVVFGALSVHLAPRLEQIAMRQHHGSARSSGRPAEHALQPSEPPSAA
jgi:hypothetical protein